MAVRAVLESQVSGTSEEGARAELVLQVYAAVGRSMANCREVGEKHTRPLVFKRSSYNPEIAYCYNRGCQRRFEGRS